MTNDSTTVIACLTPPGRGAIASLGVRGPAAWTITRMLFRRISRDNASALPLPEAPIAGQFWPGWLGDSSRGGADEVVLLVKEMTPDPWLEIHCHGGPEVIRFIQEVYQAHGVHLVSWPDFQREHVPAWQLAAQELLMHAPTARTASLALDQCRGALQLALRRCQELLRSGERDSAEALLRRLIELRGVGRHVVEPWRVVLAGPPNVGKSSLSNALAGFARSVVSPTPGTTRDVVTTAIALDGWPIELADTASIRSSADELETAGVERAEAAVRSADLCLWLIDGSAPLAPPADENSLVVINKIDLPPAWNWQTQPAALRVSAKTGAGLAELCQTIVNRLVPRPPAPGEAVPHTAKQIDFLGQIEAALRLGDRTAVHMLTELLIE